MRGRPALLLCFLLVLTLVASSCGDDGDPEALPEGDSPTFASGDFDELPIHPLSEEVGPKTTNDGVAAQSFLVRNVSREQLFDWYNERLAGWVQEAPPHALGTAEQASWRARWTSGDQRLIITTSEAPTLQERSGTDDPTLQYSLSLEPADRPLPEGEG